MSDFRFGKCQSQQDHNSLTIKQKLQHILASLHQQKDKFSNQYQKQLKAYQEEIQLKENIIESLRQHLEKQNIKIQQMTIESSNYLTIIRNLKAQIFKMASVVNNIKTSTFKPQLKRVSSDYIQNPFAKVSVEKETQIGTKIRKFDINSYFQNVKKQYPLRKAYLSSQRCSQIDDNLSSTKTIKIQSQSLESEVLRVLKDNDQKFKKTLKWRQQKNTKQKEVHHKIKDYKQNFWNRVC